MKQSQSESSSHVDLFFDAMIQLYGHSFSSAWGTEDHGVWQKILGMFAAPTIKLAIDHLVTKNHEFMNFPPNPMQFRKLCEGISKENTPKPSSKLTAPCDQCGKPGRAINFGDNRNPSYKTFCFDHYQVQHNGYKKTLDEHAKQFQSSPDAPAHVRAYNQMRLNSMREQYAEARRKFEND